MNGGDLAGDCAAMSFCNPACWGFAVDWNFSARGCVMTTITIELADTLVAQARQAGLLIPEAVEDLLAGAVARINVNDPQFEQEIQAAVEQADRPDAQWLTHEQVTLEWARERDDLLAGRAAPSPDPE